MISCKCLTFVIVVLEANQEELSPLQCQILAQSAKKVKDTVTRVAIEHKELHGGISKIGKAIDRVSISIIRCGTFCKSQKAQQTNYTR